jgi:hypothetical protein
VVIFGEVWERIQRVGGVAGESATDRIADLGGIERVEEYVGALEQAVTDLRSVSVAGSGINEAEDGDL